MAHRAGRTLALFLSHLEATSPVARSALRRGPATSSAIPTSAYAALYCASEADEAILRCEIASAATRFAVKCTGTGCSGDNPLLLACYLLDTDATEPDIGVLDPSDVSADANANAINTLGLDADSIHPPEDLAPTLFVMPTFDLGLDTDSIHPPKDLAPTFDLGLDADSIRPPEDLAPALFKVAGSNAAQRPVSSSITFPRSRGHAGECYWRCTVPGALSPRAAPGRSGSTRPVTTWAWTPWQPKRPTPRLRVDELIEILNEASLSPEDAVKLKKAFCEKFYPLMSPLAVRDLLLHERYEYMEWVELLKVVYKRIGSFKDAMDCQIENDLTLDRDTVAVYDKGPKPCST